MPSDRIHTHQSTNISLRRLIRAPVLGGVVALVFAALLIFTIRSIEAATGHVEHVSPIVLAIVMATYAAVGACATAIVFPATPHRDR